MTSGRGGSRGIGGTREFGRLARGGLGGGTRLGVRDLSETGALAEELAFALLFLDLGLLFAGGARVGFVAEALLLLLLLLLFSEGLTTALLRGELLLASEVDVAVVLHAEICGVGEAGGDGGAEGGQRAGAVGVVGGASDFCASFDEVSGVA